MALTSPLRRASQSNAKFLTATVGPVAYDRTRVYDVEGF